MMNLRHLFLTCLWMCLISPAFATVHEQTLDNGLKVVVKPDHRAPIAAVMITYHVGSADEPGGLTGISHALEHLMFKGTTNTPPGEFTKIISALGGELNAFTNQDVTAYHELIGAQHLATVFKLEADRMENMVLDEEGFKQEMKVIQEERRMRTDNNPQSLLNERFQAAAHLASPYHHPVIGWMSDIKQITMDDVKDWYARYYTPNNATLVVVGDVKPETIFALAQEHFGGIAKHTIPPLRPQEEPPALGQKTVTVESKIASLPTLMLGYITPTLITDKQSDDPYALDVMAALLNNPSSGRLEKQLIRAQQVATEVGAYYLPYARYQTQFVLIGIPTQTTTLDNVKDALIAEIKRLQTTLVEDKELNRVKATLIAEKTYEKESLLDQAQELGILETLGLGWKASDTYAEKVKAITAADIQRVAKRYFHPDALTEGRLHPIKG